MCTSNTSNCFAKFGGSIAVRDVCKDRTGLSDYMTNYKQYPKLEYTPKWRPEGTVYNKGILTCLPLPDPICSPRQEGTFSKAPKFGVTPICECVPDQDQTRFSSTYQEDFYDKHHNAKFNRWLPSLPGVRACEMDDRPTCTGLTGPMCPYPTAFHEPEPCPSPCAPCMPRLKKEDLIKPGTDTSPPCCQINCVPCYPDTSGNLCDGCCPSEYPCNLHAGAAMPTRVYPIKLGQPRTVYNGRDPPIRRRMVAAGGSVECPLQNQFPTKEAISQAREKLIDKLREERCQCPPICNESTYRATYKVPPSLKEAPKYCSPELVLAARQKEAEFRCRGLPPPCLPEYCLDGGHPPDPRPMFDHLSTYQADFLWNTFPKYNLGGRELVPCPFPVKPLCSPGVVDASEVLPRRTEEKERWGEDWEQNPPHLPEACSPCNDIC